MEITLNGEVRDIADGMTVSHLLAELGVDMRQSAVERNAEIVPKSSFDEVVLQTGDQIEIVEFIGGG